MLTACSGVLDVELPGRVQAGALDNPVLATTLVAGVQADFECAFSEFVHTTGLWANEFINSSGGAEVNGWGARTDLYESGNGICPTASNARGAYATYRPLHIRFAPRAEAEVRADVLAASASRPASDRRSERPTSSLEGGG